jgi:hypothetical protein
MGPWRPVSWGEVGVSGDPVGVCADPVLVSAAHDLVAAAEGAGRRFYRHGNGGGAGWGFRESDRGLGRHASRVDDRRGQPPRNRRAASRRPDGVATRLWPIVCTSHGWGRSVDAHRGRHAARRVVRGHSAWWGCCDSGCCPDSRAFKRLPAEMAAMGARGGGHCRLDGDVDCRGFDADQHARRLVPSTGRRAVVPGGGGEVLRAVLRRQRMCGQRAGYARHDV